MLVQVDGWSGSGKSVLMYLLDGHPEIYSHPFHDIVQFLFRDADWQEEEWVSHRDVWELRTRLARYTQYYKSESFVRQGKYVVEFRTGVQLDFPIPLDFSKIDSAFVNGLLGAGSWTPERILESVYRGYCEALGTHRDAFAFMGGWRGLDNMEAFGELYPSGKRIVVRRNVYDTVAVQAGRQPVDIEFRSKIHADRNVAAIIECGEVQAHKAYYAKLAEHAHHSPGRILFIDFEDLVGHTFETLKRVCAFLEIDHLSKNESTFLGQPIVHEGQDYAYQIFDDHRVLLRENEIAQIDAILNAG